MAAHTGKSQTEFLESHSSEDISEWVAFEREFGYPDIYFLVAQLARAILAPWTKKPVKPQDFVPYFEPPKRKQVVADHKARFAPFGQKARV